MKKYFLPVVIITLLTGACAKKSEISETDISALEAERAIAMARSEIDEAREVGADVSRPEQILEEARNLLSEDKNTEAYQKANQAQKIAAELKAKELSKVRRQDDARAAIKEAENLLSKAKEEDSKGESEVKIDEATGFLKDARKQFESASYGKATELAIKSSKLSKSIIESLRDREIYLVGSWETDRDCLWNISAKKGIYNDPWKWKKIYNANSEKIDDPDLIYPGQEFTIPAE
ncbi:MAG: LysM peptidoglycan-binding domain-containing protein [Elusimicrobiota bacterium]